MSTYKLINIIDSQYIRPDDKRHQRSILFLIENLRTGEKALFQIDRISKNSASLRCNNRACSHRLSIEHDLETEEIGKYRNRCLAASVRKEDLMNPTNWLKVWHSHTKRCTMTGPIYCKKTEHVSNFCQSKTDGQIIKRRFRSFVIQQKESVLS